jgi:hypothetical protein
VTRPVPSFTSGQLTPPPSITVNQRPGAGAAGLASHIQAALGKSAETLESRKLQARPLNGEPPAPTNGLKTSKEEMIGLAIRAVELALKGLSIQARVVEQRLYSAEKVAASPAAPLITALGAPLGATAANTAAASPAAALIAELGRPLDRPVVKSSVSSAPKLGKPVWVEKFVTLYRADIFSDWERALWEGEPAEEEELLLAGLAIEDFEDYCILEERVLRYDRRLEEFNPIDQEFATLDAAKQFIENKRQEAAAPLTIKHKSSLAFMHALRMQERLVRFLPRPVLDFTKAFSSRAQVGLFLPGNAKAQQAFAYFAGYMELKDLCNLCTVCRALYARKAPLLESHLKMVTYSGSQVMELYTRVIAQMSHKEPHAVRLFEACVRLRVFVMDNDISVVRARNFSNLTTLDLSDAPPIPNPPPSAALTTVIADGRDLAGVPFDATQVLYPQLRSLGFQGALLPAVEASEPFLQQLSTITELDLTNTQLSSDYLASIFVRAKRLRELNLSNNPTLGDAAFRDGHIPPSLTALDLHGTAVSSLGVDRVFSNCPLLSSVTCNDIVFVDMSEKPAVLQLRVLAIGNFSERIILNDLLLAKIAKKFSSLTTLDLPDQVQVGDKGIAAVGAFMRSLTELNTNGLTITDTGLCALLMGCSKLSKLGLNNCNTITGSGLITPRGHPLIEELSLLGCEGITKLAELGKALPNLHTLYAPRSATAQQLLQIRVIFPKLRELFVEEAYVTEDVINALAAIPHLTVKVT